MTTLTKPKARGILFRGDLVRKILDGSKTQTRRPIKPQPFQWDDLKKPGGIVYDLLRDGKTHEPVCPFGQPGDLLYVREKFALESNYEYPGEDVPTDRPIHTAKNNVEYADEMEWQEWAHYAATDTAPDLCCESNNCAPCGNGDPSPHWKPSIHMPKWAARIWLEITEVRVERILDISAPDLKAEGIRNGYDHPEHGAPNWKEKFLGDWNRTYPGSWDRNDWVWVISFKKVKP